MYNSNDKTKLSETKLLTSIPKHIKYPTQTDTLNDC